MTGKVSKPNDESMPLSNAETGKPVRIVSINGGRELRSRLADMGLLPGMELRVISNTGGPFIIAVKEARLALGRGMTRKIFVSHSANGKENS